MRYGIHRYWKYRQKWKWSDKALWDSVSVWEAVKHLGATLEMGLRLACSDRNRKNCIDGGLFLHHSNKRNEVWSCCAPSNMDWKNYFAVKQGVTTQLVSWVSWRCCAPESQFSGCLRKGYCCIMCQSRISKPPEEKILRNGILQPKAGGESWWDQQKGLQSLLLLCISVSVSLGVSWRWYPVNYSMSYPFKAFHDTFCSDTRNYEILRRPFATSQPWRRLMLETLWDSYFWWNCLFLQSMKMFLRLIKEYEQCFFRMALW